MKSFWKARKRSCGFVFFGALIFWVLPSFGKDSTAPKSSSVLSSPGLPSQVIGDALEFLNAEERTQDFESLQNKIILTREISLIEKVIEILLANKNRQALISFARTLSDSFRCRSSGRADICDPITKLWKGNLDSVYFYEESPGKVLRVKNMIKSGECSAAQSLLKEVELREGFPRPLVDTSQAIAECLGNKDLVLLNEKRAVELRVFE